MRGSAPRADRWFALLACLLGTWLSACGGSGDGDGIKDSSGVTPRLYVVNRLPDRTVTRIEADAERWPFADPAGPYGRLAQGISVAEGKAQEVNPEAVASFYATIRTGSIWRLRFNLTPGDHPGGDVFLTQVLWSPSEDRAVLVLDRDPSVAIEEERRYEISKITLEAYVALVASGEIEGPVPEPEPEPEDDADGS